MEIIKGQERVGKTRRVWATVSGGVFANGQSRKLAVGASQDVPAAHASEWEQVSSDLVTDLKNLTRLHLSKGEKPKLLDRMVQIIMPK